MEGRPRAVGAEARRWAGRELKGLRVGLTGGIPESSGAVEECIWAEGTARAKAPRQERAGVGEELVPVQPRATC